MVHPLPAGASERYVDVDGTLVRYLRAGPDDAPPVVLVHGGGFDAATVSWRDAIASLSDAFRVVAPDLPGFGESDPPGHRPTVAHYERVLQRFLDALALDAVGLVGISMGGAVALGVALRRPDRVARLVLADSLGLGGRPPGGRLAPLVTRLGVTDLVWPLFARSPLAVRLALRAVTGPGGAPPQLLADAVVEARRERAGEAWRAVQRSEVRAGRYRTDYSGDLPALAVPTLFVHGGADPLVGVARSIRAAARTPDAELAVFPDCGHWTPRECPAEFDAAVRPFLDGVPAPVRAAPAVA
ncbi:MAG: alpha/beta fold hydrolase [Halobacteriaceae archaeon]